MKAMILFLDPDGSSLIAYFSLDSMKHKVKSYYLIEILDNLDNLTDWTEA